MTCMQLRQLCLLCGVVALVLAALPAGAQGFYTVNCDTPGVADFNNIRTALNNTDPNGPVEIEVTGTCHERITLGDGAFARSSVYLHPAAGQRVSLSPATNIGIGNVVTICGAHGIWIEGFDISGGNRGVQICDESEVDFLDVTIENNTTTGLQMNGNSIAYFQASRIRNNGAAGIDLSSQGANTVSLLGDATAGGPLSNIIEGNGQFGINAGVSGVVDFGGSNIVRNNGGSSAASAHGGVHVFRTSALSARKASTGAGTEFSGNVGPAILAEVNSSVSLDGANIHDNTQQGVLVRTQSVLELAGSNVFSGNGISDITCDSWSLLTGDLTGISKIDCKNIDAPPKK